MVRLNLPQYEIRVQIVNGKKEIFDFLRKKFVVLTPEEWVRQHFIHLLITHYHYPKSLIKVESGLKYNQLKKRSDILVYGRDGNIFLIVECKSTDVKISPDVFDQIACYNDTIKAPYLAVTNGLKHFCCSIDHENKKYEFLPDIPSYN